MGCQQAQGLADTFILLGLPFDSAQAQQLNKEIFETIYYAGLRTSCQLAQKHGAATLHAISRNGQTTAYLFLTPSVMLWLPHMEHPDCTLPLLKPEPTVMTSCLCCGRQRRLPGFNLTPLMPSSSMQGVRHIMLQGRTSRTRAVR